MMMMMMMIWLSEIERSAVKSYQGNFFKAMVGGFLVLLRHEAFNELHDSIFHDDHLYLLRRSM